MRPLDDRIAERLDRDAIRHVGLGEVREDPAQGQCANADHADPKRLVH
jgi:hypothetical protein